MGSCKSDRISLLASQRENSTGCLLKQNESMTTGNYNIYITDFPVTIGTGKISPCRKNPSWKVKVTLLRKCQKRLIQGFEAILPLPRSTEMFRFGFSKFKHDVPSEVHSRILTAEKPSGCVTTGQMALYGCRCWRQERAATSGPRYIFNMLRYVGANRCYRCRYHILLV